jgi:hypothetical protein
MQTIKTASAADMIEARRLLLRRQKGAQSGAEALAPSAIDATDKAAPAVATKAEPKPKARARPGGRKGRMVLGDWVLTEWSETQIDPRN